MEDEVQSISTDMDEELVQEHEDLPRLRAFRTGCIDFRERRHDEWFEVSYDFGDVFFSVIINEVGVDEFSHF